MKFIYFILVMLSVIISVVLFLILFGLFFSVKFDTNKDVDFKRSNIAVSQQENEPPSSANAKYQEMRYDFLRFAEFFLLRKRPYGMQDKLPWKDSETYYGTITNHSATGTRTTSINDFSTCKRSCENDRNCNMWVYDGDIKQCDRYNINSLDDFTQPETDPDATTNQIGYIFNSNDSWAVKDLSNLPNQEGLFKEIAEMVLKLESKNTELQKRANSIKSSTNIKYCYEEEVTPDTSSLDVEYTQTKEQSLKYLENATIFFINRGSAEYANKEEYALISARILKYIFDFEINQLNGQNIIFNEMVDGDKDTLKNYVDEILGVDNQTGRLENWELYIYLKSWFASNRNSDGYVTISELDKYFAETSDITAFQTATGFSYDQTLDTCNNDITDKRKAFINSFDFDNDQKLSLEEWLQNMLNTIGTLDFAGTYCFD